MDDLATRLEGFSAADTLQLVSEACSAPLDYAQRATHFRRLAPAPSRGGATGGEAQQQLFEPCDVGDEGAAPGSLLETVAAHGADAVAPPPVRLRDFELALARVQPSVRRQELQMLEGFREAVAEPEAA